MKKIYLGAVLLAASLSSCDDFLDTHSEGSSTIDYYFNNDQQAIDAIDPIYYDLKEEAMFGRELFWEQGAACDIVWGRTRSFNTLGTFEYTGDESPLRGSYSRFYTDMARCNYIISHLLRKSNRSAIDTRTLGEAYFLRAFCHFWIAHRYGTDELGVPFVRWEDFEGEYDFSIPEQRATVMDNYALIIEDLKNAETYLPKFEEYSEGDRGRAHKAAAVGYMAKTYAYWATWDESKWQNVITEVDRLESDFGRGLADTYDEIFSCEFEDFWNREYIWSIPSTGGTNGSGVELPGVMLENKCWGLYNGWGQIKPSEDIYQELLKDGDWDANWDEWENYKITATANARLRRSLLDYGRGWFIFGNWWGFSSTSDLAAGYQVYKFQEAFKYPDAKEKGYVNTNGDYPTVRINFPLLRMGEMLLFRAEAKMMTGGDGTSDINRLRKRALVPEIQGRATMADLYHERRVELAFEYSNHLFDLKRWHRSSNAELKALAAAELNARPHVRVHENRGDMNSAYTIEEYADYALNKKPYNDNYMTFPYPSQEVTKSNGALRQLKCWGGN